MRPPISSLRISRDSLSLYGSLEPMLQGIREHRPLDLNAEAWRKANPGGTIHPFCEPVTTTSSPQPSVSSGIAPRLLTPSTRMPQEVHVNAALPPHLPLEPVIFSKPPLKGRSTATSPEKDAS